MNNNLTFNIILTIFILCCLYTSTYAESTTNKLAIATNLALDGQNSHQSNRPILLLVSRRGCPYCTQVKQEILEPMIISGNYTNKVIFREIVLDSNTSLLDFSKSQIKISNLKAKYQIALTPTLLFLGPNGDELAERIVGINTIELFSYYVDQAIDKAAVKLQTR
jgi:thioredoxin-related protein